MRYCRAFGRSLRTSGAVPTRSSDKSSIYTSNGMAHVCEKRSSARVKNTLKRVFAKVHSLFWTSRRLQEVTPVTKEAGAERGRQVAAV